MKGPETLVTKKNIEQLIQTVLKTLPNDGAAVKGELKENLTAALEASLTRMNIVTREEFDAQSALLQRTRIKLEKLERELDSLLSDK
jgi:ubiquinone biosynthesis accessory factor UbiK